MRKCNCHRVDISVYQERVMVYLKAENIMYFQQNSSQGGRINFWGRAIEID